MELTPVVDYGQLVELHPDVHPDRVTELCDRLGEIYVGNADGQALAKEIFERALSREPADAYSSAATRDIPIRPNLEAT